MSFWFGTRRGFGQGRRLLSAAARARLRRTGEAIEASLAGLYEAAVERSRRKEVEATGLFDPDWYAAAYPDVAAGSLDPLSHYVRVGGRELRKPNPLFDPTAYAAANPHVPALHGNLLVHYHRHGAWADSTPHWLFDPVWYRMHNPELREGGVSPLAHYLAEGGRQGRDPHPLFDTDWYLANNLGVAEAGLNPLVHYLSAGAAAGRDPHPLFDSAFVLAQSPALPVGVSVLADYLSAGPRERRRPNRFFDPQWYLAHNPDAAASGLNPLLHYAAIGAAEGLRPGPYFDPAWYVQHYPDSGSTGLQPLAHHLAFGAAEGREPDAFFARSRAAGLGPLRAQPPTAAFDPDTALKIVVCASVIGPAMPEPDIGKPDPRFQYVLFTDDATSNSTVWGGRVLRDALSTAVRTAALPKILAHRYLPPHDVSIWIDGAMRFTPGDVVRLVHDSLQDKDLAWLGPDGAGRVAPGAGGTAFLVRRNTRDTEILNEAWWERLGDDEEGALRAALEAVPLAARTIAAADLGGGALARRELSRPPVRAPEPRLFIFIAYAPSGYNGDLGRAYNDYMRLLGPHDYALFLDHDAMFCDPAWADALLPPMRGHAGEPILFVARTNRIGMAYQRVAALEHEHRVAPHRAFAASLAAERDWVIDVTHMPPASGVAMMLSKRTWEVNKFAAGFLGVDNRFHRALRAKKGRIFLPRAAYLYHFYRADGDETHAVQLPRRIAHTGDDHPVKTFVYDEAAGIDMSRYMELIAAGDWAILIRNRSMFCEKNWYVRAAAIAESAGESDVFVFNSNLVDPDAGRHDDLLLHRRHAAECADAHEDRLTPLETFGPANLTAFMISKRHYAELGLAGPVGADAVCRALRDRGTSVHLARGIYVYSQADTPAEPAQADLDRFAALRRGERRVAILAASPHQVGMDVRMHELAESLTADGHLVTLFSPKPRSGFTAEKHSFLLRRHRSFAEFQTQFRAHQNTFPFDVILAEEPRRTAPMAVAMKRRYGIPMLLEVDERELDAALAAGSDDSLLAESVGNADRVIAASAPVADRLRQAWPDAAITVIEAGDESLGERYAALLADVLSRWRPWEGPGKRLV